MGVMTISALALGHRGMDGLAGKILPGMTGKANLSGQGDRTGKPGAQAEYSKGYKQAPHQLLLPG